MRLWSTTRLALFILLLGGCTSDVASDVLFRCDAHEECQAGWHCAENTCVLGPAPLDMNLPDTGGIDMASPDAAPPVDMAPPPVDMAPPPVDMAPPPVDMAPPPVDMAPPPVDMAPPPVDMAPDGDGDGIADGDDNCPLIVNPDQDDSDGDGKGDACDNCPDLVNADQADEDGDGQGTVCDNCPRVRNPDQADLDGDARGDACDPDKDGDGINNGNDTCPYHADPDNSDVNGNEIGDVCEVECEVEGAPCALEFMVCSVEACSTTLIERAREGNCINGYCGDLQPASYQPMRCADGSVCLQNGDAARCVDAPPACIDSDGDGVSDADDNCRDDVNTGQSDIDQDGAGDACDIDRDADGINNPVDNCPNIANPDQRDDNRNGAGDACEIDCVANQQCNLSVQYCAGPICSGHRVSSLLSGMCRDDLAPPICGGYNPALTQVVEEECPAGLRCAITAEGPNCVAITPDCAEDLDRDGLVEDNCPAVPNADQADRDADGVGDACDPDTDGDGIPNADDNCPDVPNPAQGDLNNNGTGDDCEVPCDADAECRLRSYECEERGCGGSIITSVYSGRCVAGLCADFDSAPPDNLLPAQCPLDQICVVNRGLASCEDAPAQCELIDACNAPEDQCQVIIDRECAQPGVCGGGFSERVQTGQCEDMSCSDQGGPSEVFDNLFCQPGERCVANADGLDTCEPDIRCPEAEANCPREQEGAGCQLDGRLARCVNGVCQPWDCTAIECNELGPRRFDADPELFTDEYDLLQLYEQDGYFKEFGQRRRWSTAVPQEPVWSHDDAHQACANVAMFYGGPWRLPTMYELTALAGRNPDRLALLQGFMLADALYWSRTVTEFEAIAVNLITGQVELSSRFDALHRVICVVEDDIFAGWDLTARFGAFTNAGLPVIDPLTGIGWSSPEGNPVMPAANAQAACEALGSTLPLVSELTSLLTFNGNRQPGFWPAFNGATFGDVDEWTWAGDPAPEAMAWRVNLVSGRAELVNLADNPSYRFMCRAVE